MSDKREYILQKLQEARPDLTLHQGDPIYYTTADPAAVIVEAIREDIAEVRNPTLDEKGDNFFVPRTSDIAANVSIRFYFNSAISLSYDPLIIYDDAGVEYESALAVSRTAAEMALYQEDDYYYIDITMEGDGVFSSGSALVWTDAPDEFSHMSVTTINSSGQVAETDDDYEERIETELTLRNSVTADGFPGLLDRLYGNQVRETLSVGFLDDEMERDIIDSHHMGGMVDAYVKGNMMVVQQLKGDTTDDIDKIYDRNIMVCFEDATVSLWTNKVLSLVLTSGVRTATFTEGAGNDYTYDATIGEITRLSGGNIRQFDIAAGGAPLPYTISGDMFVIVGGGGGGYLWDTLILEDMLIVHDGFAYLVQTVVDNAGDTEITVERTIESADTSVAWNCYEPVVATMTYEPIGEELEDFDNPVMKIDSLYVLDPISDEETDVEIPPMGGFGDGNWGGGPFGWGDDLGWLLTIDDVNERYSMREAGVLELPWVNYGDRFSVNYRNLPDIAGYQSSIIDHRTEAADVLVKAFTPVYVYIDVNIEADEVPTNIDQYIWGLKGGIELSDLVDELYNQGVTMVNLDELMENSEFIIWNPDGTYEHVYRTAAGVIELDNNTLRLYPVEIVLDNS